MKMKLLVVLFAAFFGLAGFSSSVLAEECPDRHETTSATNTKFFDLGSKATEAALEYARAGKGEEARDAAKEALDRLQCIVSSQAGSKLQGPRLRLRKGSNRVKHGNMDEAVELFQEAVDGLKKVNIVK